MSTINNKSFYLFTATLILVWSSILCESSLGSDDHSRKSSKTDKEVLATLENEFVRVIFVRSFVRSKEGSRKSARPNIEIRTQSGWSSVPVDVTDSSYRVLSAGMNRDMSMGRIHPKWKAAGVVSHVKRDEFTNVIWNAGDEEEAVVRSVEKVGERSVRIDFYPLNAGNLRATWTLLPGERSIRVEMQFTPHSTGQYSLGYFLFGSEPLEEVQELLMPMTVNRKHFPKKNYTMLQAQQPTPISVMQTDFGKGSLTWGISGSPSEIPLEFPVPAESHFGMHIRNPDGQVQPSIYGPLIGTKDAKTKEGIPLEFSFRIFVQDGNWYDAYRTVADSVFGWHDYRKNWKVSLTDAVYNMIDLYKNDQYAGWWERAKAHHQIESKYTGSHASPLTPLSLYNLTGDSTIYRERVLPTLEFILSRSNQHFSPFPEKAGHYPSGSMNGPVGIYGSAVYGGLFKMTNYRTEILRKIALPGEGVNPSARPFFEAINKAAGDSKRFTDWLGRYQLTGNQTALDKAVRLADRYIRRVVDDPPAAPYNLNAFFLWSFVPKWKGLLDLYEVTGEQRFLDAAAYGGKMLMTGIWTQPTPKKDSIVIHSGGEVKGDKMDVRQMKGGKPFRLGWPIEEGDVQEKKVPQWMVSNVGLGFEQPSTYTWKEQGGRMILQAPWASSFLRLAHHTGHEQFRTYARNAVIGRWGNYPGYYYTTFTDLMQNPSYPYEGPDVSFIYYHHIPVQISGAIDYLVSEAQLRSNGSVHFPSLTQSGYAYFKYKVYGHTPGKIMNEENIWLWFKDNLVSLSNPQINYITAHSDDGFYLIMMNESGTSERVDVTFNSSAITTGSEGSLGPAEIINSDQSPIPLPENTGEITMAPRGFKIVRLTGLNIDVPSAHQVYPKPDFSSSRGSVAVPVEGAASRIRAAAIQVEPGAWQAYVWSTAGSKSLKEVTLSWSIGGERGSRTDDNYPYEFSIPVPAGESTFKFSTKGVRSDGSTFQTQAETLSVPQ